MSAADVQAVPALRDRADARVSARFLRSELRLIFGRRRNLAGLLRAGRRAGPHRRSRSRSPRRAAARRTRLLQLDHRERPVRRARRADHRARAVPAAGGRAPSPATRSPARPTSAPCATCSTVPVAAHPAAGGQVRRHRDLLPRRHAAGDRRRHRDGARPVRRRRHDPAVRHPDRRSATGCCGCCSPRSTSACCFASLGAVGLFVSTLTEQPIGAMIAVVIFSTASVHPRHHPAGRWLHPFLLTH